MLVGFLLWTACLGPFTTFELDYGLDLDSAVPKHSLCSSLTILWWNDLCLGLLSCCMTHARSLETVLKQMSWRFPSELAGIIQTSLFPGCPGQDAAKQAKSRHYRHVSQMRYDSETGVQCVHNSFSFKPRSSILVSSIKPFSNSPLACPHEL